MIKRGETKPLFRKHNVLSVRVSELRELFPNANIVRMIRLMPSLLSDEVHSELANKRHILDRTLLNFDVDALLSQHPFILSKDSDFIGRNKDNLKELMSINDNEFKIMIDAQPKLIMFDARRTIAVKYQLIAQYFEKRIESEMNAIYKAYNDGSSDGNSLKFKEQQITKEEKDKLKWTVIRNPEVLCLEWDRFGRLEFIINHATLIKDKFSVNRLLELDAQRMTRKFPEYDAYLKDRLEKDGGCDRSKLDPLGISDLEEAMGELIALEHYPQSSEIDQHFIEEQENQESDDEDDEQSNETPS